ncbi:MAG: PTS sugar transporter subunit IIA [Elusimicrobia bacterium]|nr:PTS sugar transporter subunit IIA [Elusimicrobiota bacterium]
MSDILRPESVVVPLQARTPEDAIDVLVNSLVLDLPGNSGTRQELKAAILAREKVGSTGIGSGVAIPHARSRSLSYPRLAVGLGAEPVDFRAADGEPVNFVFLLAVPEAAPKSHLTILASLSRIASDAKLLRRLKRASTATALYSLLADLPL